MVQNAARDNIKTDLQQQERAAVLIAGGYRLQLEHRAGCLVDPAIDDTVPRISARPIPVYSRPRPFSGLLGREEVISVICEALSAFSPVNLYGPDGIGKTALLRYLAYYAPAIPVPDGVVYVSAHEQPFSDLLQILFELFYTSAPSFKLMHTQIAHALESIQALILLDDINPVDYDEVQQLLQVMPRSVFVFATTGPLDWERVRSVALPGLALEDAITLMTQALGRELLDKEGVAAQKICRALEGHPLRILQATAYAKKAQRALLEVAQLAAAPIPGDALLAQVFSGLSETEQQVVVALASFAGLSLPLSHLKVLSGGIDVVPVLEQLEQLKMVERYTHGYGVSGALYANLDKLWNLDGDRDIALSYLAMWAEMQPFGSDSMGTVSVPVLQMLSWGNNKGHYSEVIRLGRAIESTLALKKRWGIWAQVLNCVLVAAQAAGDLDAEAWALQQWGTRQLCMGEILPARSALSQSLYLREYIDDVEAAAVSRHNLEALFSVVVGMKEPVESNAVQPVRVAPPVDSTTPSVTRNKFTGFDLSGFLALPLFAKVAIVVILVLFAGAGVFRAVTLFSSFTSAPQEVTLNSPLPTTGASAFGTPGVPPSDTGAAISPVPQPGSPIDTTDTSPLPIDEVVMRPTPGSEALGIPSLISPEPLAIVGCDTSEVNLSWAGIDGAQKYEIRVRSASDAADSGDLYETTAGEYRLAVACGQSYSWQVRAVGGTGEAGEWSPLWSFSLTDEMSPQPPVLTQPQNGAQIPCAGGGLVVNVPLIWQPSSDPSGIALYEVEVLRTPAGTDSAIEETLDVDGATTETSLSLGCGAQVRWRVRAADKADNYGPWSAENVFQVLEPDEITQTGALGVPAPLEPGQTDPNPDPLSTCNPVVLRWQSVLETGEDGLRGYGVELQVYDSDLADWVMLPTDMVAATTLDVTEWIEEGDYRWHVWAEDNAGNIGGVSEWLYFVCPDSIAPEPPSPLGPGSRLPEDATLEGACPLLLSWVPVEDPGGVLYEVNLEQKDANGNWENAESNLSIGEPEFELDAARCSVAGDYRWRVLAEDGNENRSAWSEWFYFKIPALQQ